MKRWKETLFILSHFLSTFTSLSAFYIPLECSRTSLPFNTRSHNRLCRNVQQQHVAVGSSLSLSSFERTDDESKEDKSTSTDASANLTPGKPNGYFIIQRYNAPADGFPNLQSSGLFQEADVTRLNLTFTNVTLPSALLLLDRDMYPDMKSALKASRDGSILIQRHSNDKSLDIETCKRGRVGDRIYPNDILYRQIQLDMASEHWHKAHASSRHNAMLLHNVTVIYEDDYMAIVNKPGGVNMFPHSTHASGEITMKEILPYVLRPPADGMSNVLPIPEAAHRLDKLTSGLVVVAKTRPSLRYLSQLFQTRAIEKTYTAICYGVPTPKANEIEKDGWHSITEPLDGKPAITFWRVVQQWKHENVELSMLELKPKTGRYRQLRRHMAKGYGCPLVGDVVFAKGIEKNGGLPSHVTKLGLFLCSSAVQFEHPYYKALECSEQNGRDFLSNGGKVMVHPDGDKMILHATIELPQKFEAIMK